MLKRASIGAVLLAAVVVSVHAQAANESILYPPNDIDSRIFIDGSTISEAKVSIWAPYNFGDGNDWEYNQIERMARWACDLYGRRVASISFAPNDVACDQMGAAAAKRDSSCYHIHEFACALRK